MPAVVTGEPETEINPPVKLWATLVTVAVPLGTAHVPSPRKKLVLDGVPVTGLLASWVPVLRMKLLVMPGGSVTVLAAVPVKV